MDDVAAVRAALSEAREAGDITVAQYLNELKKLRQAYTEGVLTWWRTNGSSFKQWATAARIVFAISPNSASCERVFSLLKLMYVDQLLSTLADAIRAALMLRYNDRVVG